MPISPTNTWPRLTPAFDGQGEVGGQRRCAPPAASVARRLRPRWAAPVARMNLPAVLVDIGRHEGDAPARRWPPAPRRRARASASANAVRSRPSIQRSSVPDELHERRRRPSGARTRSRRRARCSRRIVGRQRSITSDEVSCRGRMRRRARCGRCARGAGTLRPSGCVGRAGGELAPSAGADHDLAGVGGALHGDRSCWRAGPATHAAPGATRRRGTGG